MLFRSGGQQPGGDNQPGGQQQGGDNQQGGQQQGGSLQGDNQPGGQQPALPILAVPESVYEAARVDGASEWQMFWRITIPLLRPILALVLIMTIIGSFQVFDTVAIATRDGPVNSSRVLQLYIYDMAFGGSSSATRPRCPWRCC